ncbi:MAG: ComF family protein [Pseudohongiellaceae bacterium]
MLNRLFPADCLLCGMATHSALNLCQACTHSLPRSNRPCLHCGIELEIDVESKTCGGCSRARPVYNNCIPAFSYAAPVSKLIGQFKFNGDFAAGAALAHLLGSAFTAHYLTRKAPDLIIAVPLHRSRLQARGFNQSLEIAKVIHRMSGIPLAKHALARVKNTKPQTEIEGAKLRKRNLKGAFNYHQETPMTGNHHIALVDDVITTGATVSEAARALFLGGANQVDCFCVARAN